MESTFHANAEPKVDTIALDGPAASGKSTVGERLAERLGFLFFDTGVMYRAVTLAVLEAGLDVGDEEACTKLAEAIQIDVRPPSQADGRLNDVLIDGLDRTWEIRSPQVDGNVSVVSAYPGVRRALSVKQRAIGMRGQVVMAGRDIGTVVLPEARLKVYLDAPVEERARRRHIERMERGEPSDYEEVLAGLKVRDEIDSTRDVAPLCAADDAEVIDSDRLDVDAVYEKILSLAEERGLV
jgi:cytidylate kinase